MYIYIYQNSMKLTILNAAVDLVSGDKGDDETVTCPSFVVIGGSDSTPLISGDSALLSLVLGVRGS